MISSCFLWFSFIVVRIDVSLVVGCSVFVFLLKCDKYRKVFRVLFSLG